MVPVAVRQAEADADEALAEFERQAQENAAQPSTLDLVTDEGQPTPEDEASVEEVPDGSEEGAVEEGALEEEAPEELAVDEEEELTYRQRFLTLQGKYNAEVPRLQTQLNEMQAYLAEVRSAPQEVIPEGPSHARYLQEDEIDDYGESILDMQARMAKGVAEGVFEAKLQPYLNRIEYLENMVLDNSSQSFWSKVEQIVPDAKRVNDSDRAWHGFLDEIEPSTGLTFRDIGDRAFDAGDATRFAGLMQRYLKETGVSTTGKSTPPKVKKGSPPVKPGKVASKTVSTKAAAKPTFRESEVKAFYDGVAIGKFRGREADVKAKDNAITEAFNEGRIVAG